MTTTDSDINAIFRGTTEMVQTAKDPSLGSLVVDEERIQSVGDFASLGSMLQISVSALTLCWVYRPPDRGYVLGQQIREVGQWGLAFFFKCT